MYSGGYTGKILRINLTSKTSKEEQLPEDLARDFIGGAGFAIKYLYDEVKAGTDPLDPDNKLIFATGPFTAAGVPCASRMSVAGKSPLTGAVGLALSGRRRLDLRVRRGGLSSERTSARPERSHKERGQQESYCVPPNLHQRRLYYYSEF